MRTFRFLSFALLAILMNVGLTSCSSDDDGDDGDSNPIVGVWISDNSSVYRTEYWIFKSDGSFDSYGVTEDSNRDQPRTGTYILNNNILTLRIGKGPTNNPYTHQYIVTALSKNQLVIVREDSFKSFTKTDHVPNGGGGNSSGDNVSGFSPVGKWVADFSESTEGTFFSEMYFVFSSDNTGCRYTTERRVLANGKVEEIKDEDKFTWEYLKDTKKIRLFFKDWDVDDHGNLFDLTYYITVQTNDKLADETNAYLYRTK